MELEKLREAMRSGRLGTQSAEYVFKALPCVDALEFGRVWSLDGSIRGELHSRKYPDQAPYGTAEVPDIDGLFAIPVNLDAGRWLGYIYAGKFSVCVTFLGYICAVSMVWPVHQLGIVDEVGNTIKIPTPADSHCYDVEVKYIGECRQLDPKCTCFPRKTTVPIVNHRENCPVRAPSDGLIAVANGHLKP